MRKIKGEFNFNLKMQKKKKKLQIQKEIKQKKLHKQNKKSAKLFNLNFISVNEFYKLRASKKQDIILF